MPQPLVMRLREKTGEKKKKPDKTTAFQLPSHPAKHFRREMKKYSRPCIACQPRSRRSDSAISGSRNKRLTTVK